VDDRSSSPSTPVCSGLYLTHTAVTPDPLHIAECSAQQQSTGSVANVYSISFVYHLYVICISFVCYLYVICISFVWHGMYGTVRDCRDVRCHTCGPPRACAFITSTHVSAGGSLQVCEREGECVCVCVYPGRWWWTEGSIPRYCNNNNNQPHLTW
jgi:hypothetical protein